MPPDELLRPPPPPRIQVEVTASCNLRCRMCIVRYAPALDRSASMPFEEFRQLLDALPNVQEVALQGIGEPLIAPDIYRMVEYCSSRGISAGFNSNATLLTRGAGERLIAAGLDWLCISMDGASKETYEFVRDRARWESVQRNVDGFVALLRERQATRPHLSLVMVLMRRNLHELPALVERTAQWGIPKLFVQNLSHDFSDVPAPAYAAISQYVEEQAIAALPSAVVQPVFARAIAVAAREGVELRLPELNGAVAPLEFGGVPLGCDWPWRSAYVSHDGAVMPCCMVMGADRVQLGNVHETSFAEIWEGPAFQRFRQGLTDGQPHPVCRGCSMYRGTF